MKSIHLHQLSDEELLVRSGKDADAFAVFYDRHVARLMSLVRHRTGSTEVAFDVTAETFAKALEACATFEPRHEGSAAGWLYAIARNRLTDLYRTGSGDDRTRRRMEMRPITLTDSGLEAVERRLDASRTGVMEALATLPADERDAVEARVVQEREYEQIAAQLRVSESVVRQRVHRGIKRLRARLSATR